MVSIGEQKTRKMNMENHSGERRRPGRIGVAVCVLVFMASLKAAACGVPVFEYSMAFWHADAYEAVVFLNGEPTAQVKALLDELRGKGVDGEGVAKLRIVVVDVNATPNAALGAAWEKAGGKLPWMKLAYPAVSGMPIRSTIPVQTVWEGPFTRANIAVVLDSPCRREVAGRLAAGEAAVWVLLESGEKQKDDAAASTLAGGIATAEENLRFVRAGESSEEIRPSYSMLRVSRDDPDEDVFVEILLKSETDLVEHDEPMAFVVFGRGRVLYALVGAGIGGDNIREACEAVIGECTCEIKAENPGTDVLMAANWQEAAQKLRKQFGEYGVSTGLSGQAALPGLSTAAVTAAARDAQEQDASNVEGVGELSRNLIILALVVAVLVAVVSLWLAAKKSGRSEGT
ncbi:MAG: hypothetical protein J7M19_01100 [Planctomycetes bacterium]|nr:hypothetical protein [Planctomycetota bacterium]